MAKIVILGSAAAVNDATHDYTHFLLIGDDGHPILVDAGSNPLGKLKYLGIDDDAMQDVILTHFHPDHVGGVPNMLMHMWLIGRQTSMRVHGLHHCINRIEDTMEAYNWQDWPNFFPITFHRLRERDEVVILDNDDFYMVAYPVKHFVPTIGLRITNKRNGRVLGYSCDTEPCEAVYKIADGVDMLIHEAAGAPPGHSTAAQAAQIAQESGSKSLYLIHYPVWNVDPAPLVDEAAQRYDGPITLCKDFDIYEF